MGAAEHSFAQYVQSRLTGLSRVAFLLTGDRYLAEDLVQQALIKVAAQWERITDVGDPDPYVRRALYHQHVSWWRRNRREAEPVAELPDWSGRDPIADVATAITMREALTRLAPRQRAVLVLRFYEDLTEAQAATVLGCSVNTVKSQTRDALARMRIVAPELAEALQ